MNTLLKEWSGNHWLTIREMAVIYQRDFSTIYRWLNDGTLLCFGFSIIELSPRKTYIRRNV